MADSERAFSGLIVEALQHTKREEQTRAEADFIARLLGVEPSASLLDVPCGDGRIALELAARGYRMTGVDITLPLLAAAQDKARALKLPITFERRDMRDLPWEGEFDGAFCYWESFGYFDDAGNRAFVEAVARSLKPGARFVVDTHILETLLPRIHLRDWSTVGDMIVLEARDYDHIEGRVHRHWTFIREGKIEQRTVAIRLYAYRELCQLFELAGFTDCVGYDLVTQSKFRLGASRLVLVATRKSPVIPDL
jgi:SAM-dependent methyltransferase